MCGDGLKGCAGVAMRGQESKNQRPSTSLSPSKNSAAKKPNHVEKSSILVEIEPCIGASAMGDESSMHEDNGSEEVSSRRETQIFMNNLYQVDPQNIDYGKISGPGLHQVEQAKSHLGIADLSDDMLLADTQVGRFGSKPIIHSALGVGDVDPRDLLLPDTQAPVSPSLLSQSQPLPRTVSYLLTLLPSHKGFLEEVEEVTPEIEIVPLRPQDSPTSLGQLLPDTQSAADRPITQESQLEDHDRDPLPPDTQAGTLQDFLSSPSQNADSSQSQIQASNNIINSLFTSHAPEKHPENLRIANPHNKLTCRERKKIAIPSSRPAKLTAAMKLWVNRTYALLDPFLDDSECWFHPSPPPPHTAANGTLRPRGKIQKAFTWQDRQGKHTVVLNFGVVYKLIFHTITKQQKDGFINRQWHLSHLCGNWTCLNPAHTSIEPGPVNISRNNCFSHRSGCLHSPKCMKELKVHLGADGKVVDHSAGGFALPDKGDDWDDGIGSFEDGEDVTTWDESEDVDIDIKNDLEEDSDFF